MGAEAREAAAAARTVDRAAPRAEGGTRCRDAALQAKLDRLFLLSEQDNREAFVREMLPSELGGEDGNDLPGGLESVTGLCRDPEIWRNVRAEIQAICSGQGVVKIDETAERCIFFLKHRLAGCTGKSVFKNHSDGGWHGLLQIIAGEILRQAQELHCEELRSMEADIAARTVDGARAPDDDTRACRACDRLLPRASFSKKQWSSAAKRRCITCVETGAEAPRPAEPPQVGVETPFEDIEPFRVAGFDARTSCSKPGKGKQVYIVGVDGVELMIRVRDVTGEYEAFKLMPTTPLVELFDTYARLKRANVTSLRFLFDGQRVRGDRTPEDIGMEDGDFSTACASRSQSHRGALRRGGGSEGAAPYFRSDPAAGLLSAAQRADLRSKLDRVAAVDGALDFNELVTLSEASSGLGAKVYASLEALFASHGGRVDAVALRRSAAVGQCIRFHADENFMTLQVCLNDDFDGGDLVYLADDCALVKPRRPAGSYTVHNDRVVHGVSTLVRGVRYALLLLRQP
ncbi:hypothetical protein JL722_7654 [Aureococcus anophagefferens]|nr:hypothetical protein JL722_7654 [Aureococcus anophagefferens]